jgi:hypothetical protein
MRPSRLLLLSLLACLGLAVGTTALAQGPATIPLPGGGNVKVKLPGKGKAKKRTATVQIGIAEQKQEFFHDQRFRDLGLKVARRSIGWDTFQYDWQIKDVEDWLNSARAAGIKPLITFARSRISSKIHQTPTRAQYRAAFKEFRQRWPWVTEFVATNESNLNPPGAKNPKLAAQYYKDMKAVCRSCKIAAATILETPNKKQLEGWVKKFIKAAGSRPKYWALHNYYGANKFSLSGTKRALKATKSGEVWVTEVGGLVARRTANFAGKLKMPEGLAHATKSTRFIFDRMMTVSPRIRRVYLFHWNATGPQDTWDSALVGPDGRPRGGLTILQDRLKRNR